MRHNWKYEGNGNYRCTRCGAMKITNGYKGTPKYYDKDNHPMYGAGECH